MRKALLLLLAGVALIAADADQQQWAMIQKDSLHTGSLPEGPVPPLKRSWLATPGDPESNFTTWPIVYDGTVFARSGGNVMAVDAASGSRRWLVSPPGSKIVAPAVGEAGVYIPVPFQQILALDRLTGSELWRFRADSELEASPTLADGRMYFGAAAAKKFYCLDVETGKLVWAQSFDFEPNSVPVVSDGLVVFSIEHIGSTNAALVALDAATGKEVWRVPQQESNSSPSILDGKVILGGGDLNAYALDLKTGRQVWKSSVEGKFGVRNSPAIAFGDVFLADRIGNFYRLDGATGKRKWIYEEENTEGTFDQSFPVVAGKTMYIGGGAGWVYAIDTDTGKLQWKEQIGGFVMSGAADAERFYFGVKFRNEGLYAYEHDPDPDAAAVEEPNTSEDDATVPKAIFGVLVVLALLLGVVILVARIAAKRISKKLR